MEIKETFEFETYHGYNVPMPVQKGSQPLDSLNKLVIDASKALKINAPAFYGVISSVVEDYSLYVNKKYSQFKDQLADNAGKQDKESDIAEKEMDREAYHEFADEFLKVYSYRDVKSKVKEFRDIFIEEGCVYYETPNDLRAKKFSVEISESDIRVVLGFFLHSFTVERMATLKN